MTSESVSSDPGRYAPARWPVRLLVIVTWIWMIPALVVLATDAWDEVKRSYFLWIVYRMVFVILCVHYASRTREYCNPSVRARPRLKKILSIGLGTLFGIGFVQAIYLAFTLQGPESLFWIWVPLSLCFGRALYFDAQILLGKYRHDIVAEREAKAEAQAKRQRPVSEVCCGSCGLTFRPGRTRCHFCGGASAPV